MIFSSADQDIVEMPTINIRACAMPYLFVMLLLMAMMYTDSPIVTYVIWSCGIIVLVLTLYRALNETRRLSQHSNLLVSGATRITANELITARRSNPANLRLALIDRDFNERGMALEKFFSGLVSDSSLGQMLFRNKRIALNHRISIMLKGESQYALKEKETSIIPS